MKTISIIIGFLFCINLAESVTYTVINTNNSGAGSLREAVTNANNVVGADNITFNIPTSDTNYNATDGTWTITLLSTLPYITTGYITIDGSTQTTNQGNTNVNGPEIVINGNNSLDFAFLLASPNNSVIGMNIVNFTYGVQVYGSMATQNNIRDCYIGTNCSGTSASANQYGITVSNSASQNKIYNNIISGNAIAGIVISEAYFNQIYGNKIGTNPSSIFAVPNNDGILLNEAYNNTIGITSKNIISGNINSGITIYGTGSYGNQIKQNYIGTDVSGNNSIGNIYGIILVNSHNNVIGGTTSAESNTISGNVQSGILMNGTGTDDNIVSGNFIGTNFDGTQPLSNHVGVLLKTNCKNNIIGGTTAGQRNIISANWEIGVYLESCDSNLITGNYLGTDVTGSFGFKTGDTLIQGNGIEFNTVSKYNILGGYSQNERNIISGNRVYGMVFYGNSAYNDVIGNYIGTDVSGNFAVPNATGICVDGGSNHNRMINNVLSGNISYGLFIVTNGTFYNEFKGNFVGTNSSGTDTIPNDAGLLLGAGTRYNIIGGQSISDRNILSGNRYAGIEVADILTDYNEITGNFIGTDISGTFALPNYQGIGFTTNPKHNIINGNLISGNKGFGIYLYENSDSNTVINNKIGTTGDGQSTLGNNSSGIFIANGSKYNTIGLPGQGNIIAFNDSSGIVIMDPNTKYNRISGNSIFENGFLGIEIEPFGINYNDAGDLDDGANENMNFPEIYSSIYNICDDLTYIEGNIDTENPELVNIEVFIAQPDPFLYGEGKIYLGNTAPIANGDWNIVVPGVSEGEEITATATDMNGNTSEFSLCSSVILNTREIKLPSGKEGFHIYPNPAGNELTITGNFPEGIIMISIFNLFGQTIYEIFTETENTENIVRINISDFVSNIYILKLTDSINETAVFKFVKI
ncbi:MAG: right-handed parallel beta-helix repeat-containing protein [Bacteroidia bacterium]|nr:right-handed parallel beta-helix repeat-containing protein [Bacteroidia bacterium]